MAKARQQYFADEVTLQKENRDFSIQPELVEKLEWIEPWAQVNIIETVKVNWTALVPDADKAVDVSVPYVEDTLFSTSSDDALSARQGGILYEYIQNLQSRWRYLSNWNCATGLPVTNPSDNPYEYRAWDYYIVSTVASQWGTNYRPDWTQYVYHQASTTVETEAVKVSDSYIYDWTNWILLVNTEREIAVDSSLSTTSTNPVENRVVTNALNSKQDKLIAWANIQIAADGKTISATDTTYSSLPAASWGVDVSLVTTGEKYTWNWKQDALTPWNNISIVGTTISAVDTTYASLPAAQGGTNVSLVTTWEKYTWNNKQDAISDLQTIRDNATAWKSASDTIATYWDVVTHDANEFATSTQWAKADTALQSWDNVSELVNDAWYVTDAYHDSTKQDKLIAWANIQIASDGKTISATDTTYVASDFDIKDLADSTNLRTTWSWKQDALTAWANITIDANNEISATDTTYTAWANISISNNNVISATDNKAVWWSISWTLTDQTDLWTALWWKQDTLIAWTNVQIASDWKTISATDTTYTAGTWISIDANNVISNTQTSAEWWNITWTLSDQTDLNTALWWKQDTLAAWSNIQIAADGYTISATDTTYTAGTWISIDANNVISNTQTSAEWWNITWTLTDQTDLVTALNAKQDDMVILSYGNSNWDDFITAYQKNGVVYCRASSNSNPATGAQTRLAFMAYVNDETNPTNVEFQYYRSISSHSISQQEDQVFVYKLDKTAWWTVTVREAWAKIVAWTNMTSSYSNDVLTLNAVDTTYNTATSSTAWLVKLWSDTTQTESAQSPSSTSWRTYPVQLNSSDQMVVNVPWEDTQTWSATSTAAGTVKLFSDTTQTEAAQSVSSTANRTYWIQNNSSNQMVVNVPWTDTTYGAWTYLTINWTTFDVDTTLIATKADLANFAGFQVVATLPTSDIKTNIIYLLWPFTSATGSDKYEEWIYSNNNWIMIWETSVDLSPYFNYTTQTSDAITQWSTNLFLTSAERTKLSNTSWTNTGDETKTTIQTKLWAATSSNSWYLTSTDWSTFNNKVEFNAANWWVKIFDMPSVNGSMDSIIQWLTAWGDIILREITSWVEYYYFISNWDSTGRSTNVKNITWTTVTSKTISYTSAWICSDITTTTQYTFDPSNAWTTGQVLTKTASWYWYADAPVTSVNWNTWAVTWLQTTANLKTSLTDNSDSYYPSQKAVKTAVDAKQDTLTNQTAYTAKWTATKVPTITTNTLWQVTAITETDIQWLVPSSWTTWYVLTKTANGYEWASGWSWWGITNDTTGTTSTVTGIWAWTETEYTNLSTKSWSVLYFTF